MIYEEFKHLKQINDPINPFANCYEYDSGERFYIEPIFYTQLQGFKEHCPKDYPRIIKRIEEVVKRNKYVVFVGTYEFPQTEVDDKYIFLEINDITDPLQIFVEDKSRGSDYGD